MAQRDDCWAFNCTTQSGKAKALFAALFGKLNAKRKKFWLDRIGRKDFQPPKSSKLCESHFTEDQFEPSILWKFGIKKLRSTPVPSALNHRPEKSPRKLPHCRSSAAGGSAGRYFRLFIFIQERLMVIAQVSVLAFS
ncbi:hypothetical protein HPB48_021718 [Haemaphysalis longicornis]|uniref:THAP-type domain-containing protein n=1 Tax=Haemaphysalis longicornis TaxID=44386 RepID=A0A9J6FWF6_HAELO|nr:hypothetical protein HPB48_021718 [Haemaphysalis longicornis]